MQPLTVLDAIGPYEVLQRDPSIDVVFVGEQRGPVRSENGFLGLTVDASYADVPRPDVIVVPGGIGTRAQLPSSPLVDETAARAAQLWIEYDPQPPFDSGSPSRAPPEVLSRLQDWNKIRA